MKKFFKKFVTVVLSASMCAIPMVTAGCGSKSNGDLKITVFNGGYGTAWLEHSISRFEAEKGIKVELVKSESYDCGAETYLKSGKNLSDIYITEGVVWTDWVQKGYLEDLSDVYSASVTTANGSKTVKDFMDDEVENKFYLQRQIGTGDFKPWAMPWTAKPNAMAYNVDLLKKIPHVSNGVVSDGCVSAETNKWIAPPKTVADMLVYCDDVNAYNPSSDGDSHSYVPFGWCGGTNANAMFNVLYTWWAQDQGIATEKHTGEGTFFDFFNFGNTKDVVDKQDFTLDVYDQTGIKTAFNTLSSIIVNKSSKSYKNSLSNPFSMTAQQLQQVFVANSVTTKPAMVLASSYLENETSNNGYLDSDKDGRRDVNFEFMSVPKLTSDSEDAIYVNYEDCMFVSSKSEHKVLAKEFLAFLCSQSECEEFTKDTKGGIRPFGYDARNIQYDWSDFTNSMFDVYYGNDKVYEYPKNAVSLQAVSHVYRYSNPGINGITDLATVMDSLRTGSDGAAIVSRIKSDLNQSAVTNWVKNYHLNKI